jgi:hypothetical protein
MEKCRKYCRTGQATNNNKTGRMLIACWMSKVTNTDLKYVILITSPLQKWLRERASILRYTYIACIVYLYLYFRTLAHLYYMYIFENEIGNRVFVAKTVKIGEWRKLHK